jgi:sugar phosphate isomerase/epimerase
MATDDPVSAIERLKDNIIYCHAHDNHGISDEHNTPGDGTVDWEPVIGALVKAGYDGYIALELLVPNPDGSMSKGRDLLLNYLDAFAGLAS